MHKRQQRVLQSLRRVQAWCAANPGLVPAPVGPPDTWSPITRQLDSLGKIVTMLSDAAAQQDVQARQTTLAASDEPALRKHLRDEMHHVTQVAQALRKSVPGIGILKMPSPKVQAEGLLKAADALGREAATYSSVLVEHGLAPDFVAQLDNARSALRTSIDARGTARAGRTRATKELTGSVDLALQYVHIMDAALTKALKSNAPKLAEWKHAKRVTLVGVNSGSSIVPAPSLVTQAA